MWILIDKKGYTYSRHPGIIAIFKSHFKAAMFSHYELDQKDGWSIQEIIADEDIVVDSCVNFIE